MIVSAKINSGILKMMLLNGPEFEEFYAKLNLEPDEDGVIVQY
jgi:hypothetical protein